MTTIMATIMANVDTRRTGPGRTGPRGFTVTELLVVIAIIALVIGIVMVVFPKVTNGARSSLCMNNQRSLSLAATTYATNNKGRLPSPRTEVPRDWPTDKDTPAYKHFWVAAFGNNVRGTPKVELDLALQNGALWAYTGDKAHFRSPQDPTARLRSYSINGFVGVAKPDDTLYGDPGTIDSHYRFDTTSMSRLPQPATTMYSIVEWDRVGTLTHQTDYNFNGFLIDPDAHKHFWIDTPAYWNGDDINLSYCDGSTGQLKLLNRRLAIGDLDPDGHNFADPLPGVDYDEFRKVILPGLIN